MARRRTQGNGTVSKRPNGKWQARYTAPDGKRRSKTFDRKSDAEDWLADIRSDIRRGDYVAPSDMTLSDWYVEWLTIYKTNITDRTRRYYIDIIKRLQDKVPSLLMVQLQALDAPRLQQAMNNLTAVYSPRTVRMTAGALSAALAQAVDLNIIGRNPMSAVTLPKQRTIKGGQLMLPEDINRLIAYCKSPTTRDQRSQVYKDIILFLLRHGCRPGEARAIQVNKIKDGWITIDSALDDRGQLKGTKTGLTRDIPIALDCLDMVSRRIASSRNGWLFEGKTGKPIAHCNLARHLGNVTDGNYTPYDLRHTFCTVAVADGANLKALATITGHSVETLLKHYVHVTRSDLIEIINPVNRPNASTKTG